MSDEPFDPMKTMYPPSRAATPARPAGGEPRERAERLQTFIWKQHEEGKISEDVATLAHLDVEWLRAAASPAGGPPGERERAAARRLAVLALQSDRYARDVEYREAVDDVLAFTLGGSDGE